MGTFKWPICESKLRAEFVSVFPRLLVLHYHLKIVSKSIYSPSIFFNFQPELASLIKSHLAPDSGEPTLDGVVLTDPNSLIALAGCLADLNKQFPGMNFDDKIRKIPAYTIGEATLKMVGPLVTVFLDSINLISV